MSAYSTKGEAEWAAVQRRKGFRKLMKKIHTDFLFSSSLKTIQQRKTFLQKAIRSVKVRRILGNKRKGWKPIYEVTGM